MSASFITGSPARITSVKHPSGCSSSMPSQFSILYNTVHYRPWTKLELNGCTCIIAACILFLSNSALLPYFTIIDLNRKLIWMRCSHILYSLLQDVVHIVSNTASYLRLPSRQSTLFVGYTCITLHCLRLRLSSKDSTWVVLCFVLLVLLIIASFVGLLHSYCLFGIGLVDVLAAVKLIRVFYKIGLLTMQTLPFNSQSVQFFLNKFRPSIWISL